MARPSSTSSFDPGRLTRALQVTIMVVVLMELALCFVPENVIIRTMRWMRAVLEHDPAPTVQIHGDSVAQVALHTEVIEAQLPHGVTVRNAALPGSGPEFTYFLLRRQVKAGHIPRAILLAHSPHTFVTSRMGTLVGGFLHFDEVPEAFAAGHDFFDTLYGVFCRLSFTLRHREELGEFVKGRRDALSDWGGPIQTRQRVREAMAETQARASREPGAPLGPLHPMHLGAFKVDRGEQEFLRRTLALARAHGITVYWMTLPEHEVIATARDSAGFTTAYLAFVDSLSARGEVVVLQRAAPVRPAAEFRDHLHMRLPAALVWSKEAGRQLAQSAIVP